MFQTCRSPSKATQASRLVSHCSNQRCERQSRRYRFKPWWILRELRRNTLERGINEPTTTVSQPSPAKQEPRLSYGLDSRDGDSEVEVALEDVPKRPGEARSKAPHKFATELLETGNRNYHFRVGFDESYESFPLASGLPSSQPMNLITSIPKSASTSMNQACLAQNTSKSLPSTQNSLLKQRLESRRHCQSIQSYSFTRKLAYTNIFGHALKQASKRSQMIKILCQCPRPCGESRARHPRRIVESYASYFIPCERV